MSTSLLSKQYNLLVWASLVKSKALSTFLEFIIRACLDGKVIWSCLLRGGGTCGVSMSVIDWDRLDPEPEASLHKSESLWAREVVEEMSIWVEYIIGCDFLRCFNKLVVFLKSLKTDSQVLLLILSPSTFSKHFHTLEVFLAPFFSKGNYLKSNHFTSR